MGCAPAPPSPYLAAMPATHSTRMLILGSGPAGLSAAIYGARAGLAPIVVQGIQPGGQLTTTTDVENYPGFRDVIQGPWLMEEMQAQAEHVGAQMMWDHIVEVDLTQRPFRLVGDGGTIYTGDVLVIATGAQAKWLNLPSEEHLKGRGVSACATCDGFFYRGRKVAVIGGGNTAVEEALYMTNHSHDVTLIHRRDSLRAEKILQDRLFANPKIKVLWNKAVDRFVAGGEPEGLVGLDLRDTKSGEMSHDRRRGRLRRDRPFAGDRIVQGQADPRQGRLYRGRAGQHPHQRRGRLRLRRRHGQDLPPGGDGGRDGLHGGARRGEVPGRDGVRGGGRRRPRGRLSPSPHEIRGGPALPSRPSEAPPRRRASRKCASRCRSAAGRDWPGAAT